MSSLQDTHSRVETNAASDTVRDAASDTASDTRSATAPLFLARGALESLDADTRGLLMSRASERNGDVRALTASVIDDVRARGDRALLEMAQRFDGATLETLEVPRASCDEALAQLPTPLRNALERSARNIESVHRAFVPISMESSPEPGITVGRRADPLGRVGVYAPGGRAAYPSSLLMGAIPARVAGVGEVIVCSPPTASGSVAAVVLAAAALAKVDRVFAIGGAGAVAAMAIGTATVPRVDRVVGPGNAFVAEAKLQLVGEVAIDSPAGPSELLVIADSTADAVAVANEIAAQAEHDPQAAVVVLVVGSQSVAMCTNIVQTLERILGSTPRSTVIQAALSSRGAMLTAQSLDAAIAFANEWAAEHLLLALAPDDQRTALAHLRSAGTIFLGESSSVAFGDYMTGANHVLPTAGLARCYSGLSTTDFVRWTSWQRVSPEAARRLSLDVAAFADAEGLTAHADAARHWNVPVVSQPKRS